MEIETMLRAYMPESEGMQAELAEAMRYSVFTGGKRIRPRLMLLAWEMYGGQGENPAPFMAAMEMLHT